MPVKDIKSLTLPDALSYSDYMKHLRHIIVLGLCGVAWQVGAAPAPAYHVVQKVLVPGDGGWDYLTLDSDNRRLYITHGTELQILDVDQMKPVGFVEHLEGIHGVAIATDLGRGFISDGKADRVVVFDLKTFHVSDRIKVGGKNPDTILYVPAIRQVFTFNGRSSDATAIEAASGQIVKRIPLGGRPEFAVTDEEGNIYVDLEDRSELAHLDTRKLVVKDRWPLAPCEEPSALAMDRESNRLFVGCHNKLLMVVNAATGKIVSSVPIGEHVDAVVFDSSAGLIFSANGDGTLTVIQEDSLDTYHVVDTVTTQPGARTVALDTKTHRLFLAVADRGPAPETTAKNPHPRPPILPGTFAILVVAPSGK